MKWKLLLLAAALLVLGSYTVAEKRSKRWIWPKNLIDIDSKDDGSEIGSGNNAFDTDDEDLFVGREGSTVDDDDDVNDVSGSGTDSREVTTLPETTRSFTACEQLKQSTKVVGYTSYVPKCTDSGEFERLQCRGTLAHGKCWCVGPKGAEIPGTLMDRPNTPDCISGSNLKACSFKYLKTNYKVLGSYRPRCTLNGDYERIQCYEGECWCVDQDGVEIVNTRTRGRSPVCEDKTDVPVILPVEVSKPTSAAPSKEPKTPVTKPEYEIDPTDNGVVNIDDGFTPIPEVDESEKPTPVDETVGPILTVEDDDAEKEEKDQNRDNSLSEQRPLSTSTLNMNNFVNKPFILGAIIAGAVVGLLGAILLVMFIVYRMRKKDEGSYALEEQKFTNYSYMKAPDKEFYA